MAIGRFLAPLNGQMIQQQIEKPYVDDIFDPLFNRNVVDYYNKLYGNRLIGTVAGYADMWENALTGQKGILGPGMGILSTFGRSMDKADDFILGGLTEGVNALGQITGGTNRTPINPIENIFANDYNYEGTGLMAAAGNAMARLANAPIHLDETDFQSFGDKVLGTGVDLATDPGILGGRLAKLNPNTPVGQVGQIMSKYDDIMANVAGNTAIPGMKFIVGKEINKIKNLLGNADSTAYADTVIDEVTGQPRIEFSNYNSTAAQDALYTMAEDYQKAYNFNPIDDPTTYADLENIREFKKLRKNAKVKPIVKEELQKLYDTYLKETEEYKKATEHLKNVTDTERTNMLKTVTENNIQKHSSDFASTYSTNYLDAQDETALSEVQSVEDLLNKSYTPPKIETGSEVDAKSKNVKYASLYDYLVDKYVPNNEQKSVATYIEYLIDRDASIEDIKSFLQSKMSQLGNSHAKRYTFLPKEYGFGTLHTEDTIKILDYHFKNYLRQVPDGFRNSFLRKQLGINIDANTENLFDQLYNYAKGVTKKYKHKGKGFYYTSEFGDKYITFLKSLTDNETGLLQWTTRHSDILNQTKEGRALIDLANNITDDVLIPTSYKTYLDSVSFLAEKKASYAKNPKLTKANIWDLDSVFDYTLDAKSGKITHNYLYDNQMPYLVEDSTIDPVKELNNIFIKQSDFTPEEIESYAKDFPYFDIKDRKTGEIVVHGKREYPLLKVQLNNIQNQVASEITYTPRNIVKVSNTFSKLPTKEYTNWITVNDYKRTKWLSGITNSIFKPFTDNWNLPNDLDFSDMKYYIKTVGTKQEKTLFALLDSASETVIKNKAKISSGALHVKLVQNIKEKLHNLTVKNKYTPEQISEYISRKDMATGVSISKDNFLESILAAGGFKEVPFDKGYNKAQVDTAVAALQRNVDKINKYGNILKIVDLPKEDGTRRIAVMFDVDNLNIKNDINKIYGLFGRKDLNLEDVIFRPAKQTTTAFDVTELDNIMNETRQASEALATTLGYRNFNPNYIAHAMSDSKEAQEFFSGIYKDLGINKDKLDRLCSSLQDIDISSGRLQFGALPMERAHLGIFSQYAPGYSTDLETIFTNTFTEGMLDNTNAQTFFDLFLTDNFKINKNFKDVETLKKALFMTDESGKYTGNLNNLSLVKPNYNEAGKLTGFTKWNKFSDIELTKAFNDPNTILVPNNIIGPLDRICKKNARMNSKIYRIINKYLTVPFKFGTLANPGFLVGNIEDAYFKQATELAKKYNTTLDTELANVSMSMRHVITLNNQFSDIFDGYRSYLKTQIDNPNTVFSKSIKKLDLLTPEEVMSTPDLLKEWTYYLNGSTLKGADLQKAKLYTFLNNYQNVNMFNNNNLDLEDVRQRLTTNEYNAPSNIVDRIFYGNPNSAKEVTTLKGNKELVQNKGINTYGLFLNNPVSNKILKSSNQIETLMRSATILNDLEHRGYSIDKIIDILELPKSVESKMYQDLHISMMEAVNTMHAANFDYDNVSELMNKTSYILPFPTFYLKNIGFWADVLVNKPQYIDNIISVQEGMWSGKDTSDKFAAEAKGRGAIPIGQQGNKHLTGIVKQSPYNSMFGAFNAVNNFKEDFAYRTNPALRPIARHLQNPEDVKYRPYNTNQFQKNITQNDPQFSELAYMFHQLNPYERFINTGLRIPGKIANNSYQLSDFAPSLFQPDFSKKKR